MKNVIFALLIFGSMLLLLKETADQKPPAIQELGAMESHVKNEASQYPKERAEYLRMKRGSGAAIQTIEHSSALIRQEYRRLSKSKNYKDAGLKEWDNLGPDNIGGRIRAIAIDPDDSDVILIGAAAGGVWRSSDGGSTWTMTNEEHQSYPIMDLTYDPLNSNVVYASTGEFRGGFNEYPGVGVLRSTNDGQSWTVVQGLSVGFNWLSKVRMPSGQSDTIYVSGSTGDPTQNLSNGVIYRYIVQSDTWSTLYINPFIANVADMEINPNNSREMVIGSYRDAQISRDRGVTFQSLMLGTSPLIPTPMGWVGRRCEVQYCLADPQTIYVLRYLSQANGGFRSELWRSNDGGLNWALQDSSQVTNCVNCDLARSNFLGGQGDYDNVLWVDPTNCNIALMGGVNLWRENNGVFALISDWRDDIGGSTSTGGNNSVHADQHVIIHDPNYNGTTNRRVYIGNDGGLYKTEDIYTVSENSNWVALNHGLGISQFIGGYVSKNGRAIGGTQDNSFFSDSNVNDPSLDWQHYTTGDGGYSAILSDARDMRVSTTQNGSVWLSCDGGITYSNIASFDGNDQFGGGANCVWSFPNILGHQKVTDNPLFYAPLKLDPNDKKTIYVGAERLWRNGFLPSLNIWLTAKGDVVSGRAISAIDIAIGDSDIIWVGYSSGELAFTTNGGSSWSNPANSIPIFNPADSMITDIVINPQNHDEIIVTRAGFTQTNVYYTNDNGATPWQNISLDFDMQVNTVLWHPEIDDWVYLGTDFGVFASEDRGVNWSVTPINTEGEGPVFTGISELVWQGDGTDTHPYQLCVFTHGRGLWRSHRPILGEIYVNKSHTGVENGTLSRPYNTITEAVDAAGHGATITFLSNGDHLDANNLLIDQRIGLKLNSGGVIIK